MFSFIKWLENFISNIKRNKGLMFTILSIISIVGIFLSLYFVSYLVEDVAHQTYLHQKKQFNSELKNNLSKENDFTLAIASSSSLDNRLIELFQNSTFKNTNDANDTNSSTPKSYDAIAKKYAENINRNLSRTDIKIKVYTTPKSDGDKIQNGIVVQNTGTYFEAKMPFAQNDTEYLKIKVTTDIASLQKSYKAENKEFIYLLNDASINQLDRTVYKKLYQKINNNYAIKTSNYPAETIATLKELNFSKLLKDGFIQKKDNYYSVTKVFDTNGNEIGLIMIGDKIGKDSLVKLVKSLVNNVTMVALGLIVSMILFLF